VQIREIRVEKEKFKLQKSAIFNPCWMFNFFDCRTRNLPIGSQAPIFDLSLKSCVLILDSQL
jgi:hypothetical protein